MGLAPPIIFVGRRAIAAAGKWTSLNIAIQHWWGWLGMEAEWESIYCGFCIQPFTSHRVGRGAPGDMSHFKEILGVWNTNQSVDILLETIVEQAANLRSIAKEKHPHLEYSKCMLFMWQQFRNEESLISKLWNRLSDFEGNFQLVKCELCYTCWTSSAVWTIWSPDFWKDKKQMQPCDLACKNVEHLERKKQTRFSSTSCQGC